jgi:hypothetical protein
MAITEEIESGPRFYEIEIPRIDLSRGTYTELTRRLFGRIGGRGLRMRSMLYAGMDGIQIHQAKTFGGLQRVLASTADQFMTASEQADQRGALEEGHPLFHIEGTEYKLPTLAVFDANSMGYAQDPENGQATPPGVPARGELLLGQEWMPKPPLTLDHAARAVIYFTQNNI